MIRRITDQLRRDERGVTIIEFALIAPVMCMLLLGAFDFSHTLWTRAQMQGIVQKVARDATLEDSADTGALDKLDDKVREQVKALNKAATIKITRRFYRNFYSAAAAKAEAWTDTNKNNRCDAGEPYQDDNRNNVWDRDGGDAGQGGARDATLYTVEVSYPRMLPIYNFIGGSKTTKLVSSTVLKNQPYGDQATYAASVVRNCL